MRATAVIQIAKSRTAKGFGERVESVQKFLVMLNLKKIRSQLAAADAVAYTDEDVRKWLRDAGFEAQGNKWIVSEADLGHVDPSEVLEITPLDS